MQDHQGEILDDCGAGNRSLEQAGQMMGSAPDPPSPCGAQVVVLRLDDALVDPPVIPRAMVSRTR
jgi:hypothetical protein